MRVEVRGGRGPGLQRVSAGLAVRIDLDDRGRLDPALEAQEHAGIVRDWPRAARSRVERRAHVLRRLRAAEQPDRHALEAVDRRPPSCAGRARRARARSVRITESPCGHRHLRRIEIACRPSGAAPCARGAPCAAQEEEVVRPALDGQDLIVVADDLAPPRLRLREVAKLRHVHRDLAAHAVARDRVGLARIGRNVDRRGDELGYVARAAHAGREHDLVVRHVAAQHVAIDANVGVALRVRPGLGNARVEERAAVGMPREVRPLKRARSISMGRSRGPVDRRSRAAPNPRGRACETP